MLYGILLFTGFESSANLAEETPNPQRHIRAAVMSTAGIATIFFVLATYVEVAGFHYSLKTLGAAASAPLFALGASKSAGGYGGTWIDRLLELVVLFDMLAVGIGCGVSASRGIFAMAEDGKLPGPLAVVSKRRNSPLGATVFVTGFCAVALLADVFWKGLFALPETPHYDALFSWGSTFGGFALVVVYLLMAIGSPAQLRPLAASAVARAIGSPRHLDHRGRHLRISQPHRGQTRAQLRVQPHGGLCPDARLTRAPGGVGAVGRPTATV